MASTSDTAKRLLPRPVKRVLRSAVNRYHNRPVKPYLVKQTIEGVVFDFWICDRTGRDWYDDTDESWPEMRFMRDHLIEQGDVVLECGGHHGNTTILLSNWVGNGGKVVTFEASPRNCDVIDMNIEQNKIRNVVVERKAVGAAPGRVTISRESNSSVIPSGGVEVELTCLDEYEQLRPTLLKIDVEGFEAQVLQGAKKVLSTRPKLAIEIHYPRLAKQYGASVEDLFRLIGVEDYKLWIQWESDQQPEDYDIGTPIEQSVHLFGMPV